MLARGGVWKHLQTRVQGSLLLHPLLFDEFRQDGDPHALKTRMVDRKLWLVRDRQRLRSASSLVQHAEPCRLIGAGDVSI